MSSGFAIFSDSQSFRKRQRAKLGRMPICFVIQPFDKGKFDKRFRDVFKPAIEAAELEPYRVDRDPGVSIPIEEIESSIANSAICLADITTDNPNVWFELGYALREDGRRSSVF